MCRIYRKMTFYMVSFSEQSIHTFLGCTFKPCCIQKHVILNSVMKMFCLFCYGWLLRYREVQITASKYIKKLYLSFKRFYFSHEKNCCSFQSKASRETTNEVTTLDTFFRTCNTALLKLNRLIITKRGVRSNPKQNGSRDPDVTALAKVYVSVQSVQKGLNSQI